MHAIYTNICVCVCTVIKNTECRGQLPGCKVRVYFFLVVSLSQFSKTPILDFLVHVIMVLTSQVHYLTTECAYSSHCDIAHVT